MLPHILFPFQVIAAIMQDILSSSLNIEGLLQVHFAAGTIKIGIQLHCQHVCKEVEEYGYNSLLCPCCSSSDTPPLHIAFVRYKSTSFGMNHFIPLYPELHASKFL